ncbi:MAG: hypothetical protein NDJ90_02855 [Oligoflexia bacterium]|nr:hypothetical protein [Oligoflexia bacterium]
MTPQDDFSVGAPTEATTETEPKPSTDSAPVATTPIAPPAPSTATPTPTPAPEPVSAAAALMDPLTPALPRTRHHFPWSMRFLGVFYAAAALVFVLYPTELLYLLNVGPKVFNVTEALAEPTDRFWIVIAASSMAMLSALSFFAAESPKIRGYSLVHLLAKTVTMTGFAAMFIHDKRYFAYLVGAVVDAIIVFLVLRSLIGKREASPARPRN